MILKKVADLIWGDWLVALIFFTGIYYTFILKGLQFKKFPYIIKKTFFSKNDYHQKNDNVTCIQALKAALGSCIGNWCSNSYNVWRTRCFILDVDSSFYWNGCKIWRNLSWDEV